jgi:SAM-dependent methyltransferase
MRTCPPPRANGTAPTPAELDRVFRLKHGDPRTCGWRPRTSYRMGYFTPDDHYEALVDRLVTPATTWLDVGCGRDLFPQNKPLALELSRRCELLVGVDPDVTLEENPFVHRKVRSGIEEFAPADRFDLVTLRMVAEHIADPARAVAALARLAAPGGRVVIYTVNRWSPVAIAAALVPFRFHHAFKHAVWRTEEKDTFPVVYKMNTRRALREWFGAGGFREASFARLDDCRTFARFRPLHLGELAARRLLGAVGGLSYPESCLLGVYERT